MVISKYAYPNSNWECDSCDTESAYMQQPRWFCNICECDICFNCHPKDGNPNQVAMVSPDTSERNPSPVVSAPNGGGRSRNNRNNNRNRDYDRRRNRDRNSEQLPASAVVIVDPTRGLNPRPHSHRYSCPHPHSHLHSRPHLHPPSSACARTLIDSVLAIFYPLVLVPVLSEN